MLCTIPIKTIFSEGYTECLNGAVTESRDLFFYFLFFFTYKLEIYMNISIQFFLHLTTQFMPPSSVCVFAQEILPLECWGICIHFQIPLLSYLSKELNKEKMLWLCT